MIFQKFGQVKIKYKSDAKMHCENGRVNGALFDS